MIWQAVWTILRTSRGETVVEDSLQLAHHVHFAMAKVPA